MRPIGCKDKSFIYLNPACLVFVLRFTQSLEIDKVNKALSDTLRQNKHLCVRPVFVDNKVYYEENTAPYPVIAFDNHNGIYLGTEDTNGYLFTVVVKGDCIDFVMAHALADYAAFRAVIRQFCGYLAMSNGIEAGEELTFCTEVTDEMDAYYPYEKYKNDMARPTSSLCVVSNPLAVFTERSFRPERSTLKVNESDFVQYFKDNHTSFAPRARGYHFVRTGREIW